MSAHGDRIRMFSGCMDEQTSADVQDVSKFGLPDAEGAGGACTNAVLANLVRFHPNRLRQERSLSGSAGHFSIGSLTSSSMLSILSVLESLLS